MLFAVLRRGGSFLGGSAIVAQPPFCDHSKRSRAIRRAKLADAVGRGGAHSLLFEGLKDCVI